MSIFVLDKRVDIFHTISILSHNSLSLNSFMTKTATTTRKERKQKTQGKILRITLNRVAKDGFSDVNTIDIANDANVSHGTVFLHFHTKEELITSAMMKFAGDITT